MKFGSIGLAMKQKQSLTFGTNQRGEVRSWLKRHLRSSTHGEKRGEESAFLLAVWNFEPEWKFCKPQWMENEERSIINWVQVEGNWTIATWKVGNGTRSEISYSTWEYEVIPFTSYKRTSFIVKSMQLCQMTSLKGTQAWGWGTVGKLVLFGKWGRFWV